MSESESKFRIGWPEPGSAVRGKVKCDNIVWSLLKIQGEKIIDIFNGLDLP